MNWNWKLFAAVSTLTGTIVGAGFLGIPYVVAKSGFLIGLVQIILIGIVLLIANLYLGEIMLRTKKIHQLPGLAKIYLGEKGYGIMFFSMLFGIYSALIAYLIGEGESLSYIFTGGLDYAVYFAVGFWIVLSCFVYKGIRALKKGESIGIFFVFAILALILITFLSKVNTENLMVYNWSYAFLPVGVIIFALLGFSAIPEVLIELRRNEKLMKKAIIIGSLLPIIVYCLFTLIVVGFSGSSTPEIATFALGKIFILLGVFTMFTAFFALSMAMRDIYKFDLHYGNFKSWLLACLTPLILYLIVYFFDLVSFTEILGIGGVISGGLSGILILLMVGKARKIGERKPEYKVKLPSWIIFILILVLVIGMLFQLIF
jgi:tyrosine-specific transport protein